MEKKINAEGKTVKTETMWMVASIALVVGFIGGVVFGVYKTRSDKPIQKSMISQPAEKDQGVSVERAAQIFKLEKITKENPDDVAAWTSLGNLYFDTGNHQKAITAYSRSLELNPNNANVITDLGIMYRRSGQPKKAIESFDKAAKIDPKHETALFNKGIVLMHDLNDLDGAVQAWQELVKRNPDATSPTGQPVKDLIERMKESKKQ
ncbi:MAG: tetratricopeptide repeat protein [Thermodesulfobacteriota bacterium]|nr:MAG: tetratricopeptide repeat protein [Thermodesulfobacteriota bacterium]